MYEYRIKPLPVDENEPHIRAKFAYYRDAEARINAGPAKVTYTPAPIQPRRKVAECGTYAGWAKHLREGSAPDRDCLNAHNLYKREYRARGRAA